MAKKSPPKAQPVLPVQPEAPRGIWRSTMYCLLVGIRAITRLFTIVDLVSETGEDHARYFNETSRAELAARKALAS